MRNPLTLLEMNRNSLYFAGLSLLLAAALGCTDQEEGDRCDIRNGSLDCEAPLLCQRAADLSLQGETEGFALCCPAPGQVISVDACRAQATTLPPDVTPDVDAGSGSETPSDAGTQAPDASVPTDASTGSLPDAAPALPDAAADAS